MSQETVQALGERIEAVLAAAELFVGVEVTGDGIELNGQVDSEENRQAALDLAASVAAPAGVPVLDAIEIESFLPDDAFGDTVDGGSATDDYDRTHDDEPAAIELEPNYAGDVGTTDAMRVVEEGETYFAPTDPVVRPSDDAEQLAMVGGFEATAMDAVDQATTGPEDDDAVAQRVRLALRLDALTSDLAAVRVLVRDGTVVLYGEVETLEDAENAEAVAAEAADGREVEEQLKISPTRP